MPLEPLGDLLKSLTPTFSPSRATDSLALFTPTIISELGVFTRWQSQ